MKTLVVGGAGYIGSHMLRLLLEAGHQAATFDNFSTGHRAAVGNARLFEGDLLDPASLDVAIAHFQPEVVLHFAARSIVHESMRHPALYYVNNVVGTLNLLTAMRTHSVHRMVFSSTAAVYGIPQQIPIDEMHPLMPINAYGWSKSFVERIIEDHCRSYGMRAISLRYFNAAGADPSGEIGEAHAPETHLIPNVLRVAAGIAPVVDVFGADHDTADGYAVRDFVHVNDLADAHLLAMRTLQHSPDGSHGIFNLGNGRGFSVMEVLEAAEQVVGKAIPRTLQSRKPEDPPILVASSDQARHVLGWKPRYTDLHSIIETAWRWHQAPRY